MFRLLDPYALAMCFLVGGVGFGITYYINTAVTEWGAEEIAYPVMAMVRDAPAFSEADPWKRPLLFEAAQQARI